VLVVVYMRFLPLNQKNLDDNKGGIENAGGCAYASLI